MLRRGTCAGPEEFDERTVAAEISFVFGYSQEGLNFIKTYSAYVFQAEEYGIRFIE